VGSSRNASSLTGSYTGLVDGKPWLDRLFVDRVALTFRMHIEGRDVPQFLRQVNGKCEVIPVRAKQTPPSDSNNSHRKLKKQNEESIGIGPSGEGNSLKVVVQGHGQGRTVSHLFIGKRLAGVE
jgi:hypothetical protein